MRISLSLIAEGRSSPPKPDLQSLRDPSHSAKRAKYRKISDNPDATPLKTSQNPLCIITKKTEPAH